MQNDFKQEEKEEESYVNSLSHRAWERFMNNLNSVLYMACHVVLPLF
jgi:hypothetical protein